MRCRNTHVTCTVSSVKSSEVICPANLCYADREPEHIMLQSDSTETWRPGWCLLTNTHEQAAAGTQSEWLHDWFVKSQEKESWVRVTEIYIFSRSPPQTPSDSLLSAMCTFLSLCPSRHSVEGGPHRPVEKLTVEVKKNTGWKLFPQKY